MHPSRESSKSSQRLSRKAESQGKLTKVNKDRALVEYVHGGKAADAQNQGKLRAACKVLLQLVAKLESEEAVALDTKVLLFTTNMLVQRGDISAIRSLEFRVIVDAYKIKPPHERTD
jgi:hypothetical protein